MEACSLTVSHVTKEGPFLQVWGQMERRTAELVECVLGMAAPQFNTGAGLPHRDFFQIGIPCCVRYKDWYFRARITDATNQHGLGIKVLLVDIGLEDVVAADRIRTVEGFDDAFLSIPAQASPFLLAEAVTTALEWNDSTLEMLNKDLRGHEVRYHLVTKVTNHFVARIYVGIEQLDLASLLIKRGMMQATTLATQEVILLCMMIRPHMPGSTSELSQVVRQQSVAAYKAYTLEPGQYEVYVAHVTEGPSDFSVQLKQSQAALRQLMGEVNSMDLCPLNGIPNPGNVCLARCLGKGHICRAVATSIEEDGLYKMFCLDFGNFESLPFEALYEIPSKYAIPSAMAIRYAISGVEKSAVTPDMKRAFEKFVDCGLMHMRVLPMTSRSSLPKCELWNPTTGVTAIGVLTKAAPFAYPRQTALAQGSVQPVKVSYVVGCSRLFVQLKCKEDELNALIDEIQIICQGSDKLNPQALKLDLPCYALYEGDGQFYRGQIVELIGDGSLKVKYVDYGNEELVTVEALRPIETRHLTVMVPQAIHCCLNGFENMEANIKWDGPLEEEILEQEFTMKIVQIIDGTALIELIDSKNCNVNSRLLVMVANVRLEAHLDQVLADNKIIQKKREPEPQVQQPYKKHNKFDRQNTKADSTPGSSSQGGFHKKTDNYNKRYSSQKNFQSCGFKGQRHERGLNKWSFDRAGSSFINKVDADPWNIGGSKSSAKVPNVGPSTAQFKLLTLDPPEASVIISWFHNPAHFYCQLKEKQARFKSMMGDIQEAYRRRMHSTAEVGAPCVGLFPADNVLYRARVLEKVGSKYKVQYVDFGNTSVIDKVWPIETRFLEMPAQAVCCRLSGLAPPGDAWTDTDRYAEYFNKDTYHCKFLNIADGRNSVQLSYNNQDIGDQLVQSGLASSHVLTEPRIVEESLLRNQQFRAMLLCVNSLADFVILLQSGERLLCSVFNLGNATEQFEGALKEKLGQILIVHVDNIVDERLQVTLYDGTGTKIKLIDADQGASETVEILCSHPVFYSTVTGYVTHADESTVFLQPSEGTANIDYLLNELFNSYNGTTLETPLMPKEGFVYGVLGTDGNWYRGKFVTFSIDTRKLTVNYIDYGNSEEVASSALRELTAEFMEMHIQCIPVVMDIPTDELVYKTITVSLTSDEAGWKGALVQQDQAVVIEQAILAEEKLPAEVPQEVPLGESKPDAAQVHPLDLSQGTLVMLSHTNSPNDFYLQLVESLSSIDELEENLQELVADMPDMTEPSVGVLCAAPYSVDQQWYRASVLHVGTGERDITTVRFLDYGNTEELENGVTKVKTLPRDLLSLGVYAIKCSLRIISIEERRTEATERFQQLVNTDHLVAKFVSQDVNTKYVELTANGQNVAEVLIGEGLADKNNDRFDQPVLVQNGGEIAQKNCPEPITHVERKQNPTGKLSLITEQGKTIFRAEFVMSGTAAIFEWNEFRLDLSAIMKRSSAASGDEIITGVRPEEETSGDVDLTAIAGLPTNIAVLPDEEAENEEEFQDAQADKETDSITGEVVDIIIPETSLNSSGDSTQTTVERLSRFFT